VKPVDPFNQPSPLMDSMISIDQKSPKQKYFESVEQVKDSHTRAALTSLYDFGFINFNMNNMLLQKHCGDVNTVANTLMSGALSESEFGAMYN